MPATYFGASSMRPGVLPEYYGGEPGAEIAAALRGYADARRQQRMDAMAEEESKTRLAGEKQRQAHARKMDPLEEARAILLAEQLYGLVPRRTPVGEEEAGPAIPTPTDQEPAAAPMLGVRGSAFRPGASELPAIRRPVGMPGAFHPGAHDFIPALPDMGPREYAGHMSAALLRVPVDAGMAQARRAAAAAQVPAPSAGGGAELMPGIRSPVFSPGAPSGPAPAAAPAEGRRPVGDTGYDVDPELVARALAPRRQALIAAGVRPDLADAGARDPELARELVRELTREQYEGRYRETPAQRRDREIELEQMRVGGRVSAASIAATSRAAVAREDARDRDRSERVTAARDEARQADRDVEIIESLGQRYESQPRDSQEPRRMTPRYKRALRRQLEAHARVRRLSEGGAAPPGDRNEDEDEDEEEPNDQSSSERAAPEGDPQAIAAQIVGRLREQGVTGTALRDSLAVEMQRRGFQVTRRPR